MVPASSSRSCYPTPPSSRGGPDEAPDDVGNDPIGTMAQRRITDAAQHREPTRRPPEARRDVSHRATPTCPGPGSPAGAACSQPRSTSRPYETVTGGRRLRSAGLAIDRPAGRVAGPAAEGGGPARRHAAWARASARCASSARVGPIDLVRPGDVVATLSPAGPAGPPDHACPVARPRSASPTSCAGSTRTTTTRRRCCTASSKLTPVRFSALERPLARARPQSGPVATAGRPRCGASTPRRRRWRWSPPPGPGHDHDGPGARRDAAQARRRAHAHREEKKATEEAAEKTTEKEPRSKRTTHTEKASVIDSRAGRRRPSGQAVPR